MKHRICFKALLICVTAVMLFAGCSGEKKADITPLLGTWVRTETDLKSTYTLKSDSTYEQLTETTSDISISMEDSGTFTYDGSTITFTSDSFGTEFSYDVSFSGDTMYWDSGAKKLEYVKS